MANIIVVPLKEETKAIEALRKIKELDAYGDITLYEYMMIRKIENNQYQVFDGKTEGQGWRTLTSAAVGGLLGVLVGPVGFVIGLYSGLAIGAVVDISRYEFEKDFIKKVSNKLSIGVVAIIAEVSEDSAVFIENALSPITSEILMSEAAIEFDDYLDEQIEELEDKIDEEREKLKKALTTEKRKVKIKIDALKARRKTKVANLEAKRKFTLKEVKGKTISRINKMESRIEGYERIVVNSFEKARKKRLKKRIKKQEKRLEQLHSALGEYFGD
ncbi:DUF1269 domain-containing protein [Polaribacter sp. SA4-12]|uniref:DUF1269 domain-containing protein n=1 Tax=Polaribacter sp. SA4-12 TaxID=1312072 RepID=UPI000B3C5478|nr:DUF1269 domain-containing protein [Polaribacter sp. SA4-12]ARV15069.1 hypothetical protein BTO07_07850 [Polaribacter sp. SA4-12]